MLRARSWTPLAVIGAVAVAYGWLAFHVLSPDTVFSSDLGIKFVQAQELYNHHFRSLAIVDRAAALDPHRVQSYFTMFRPPFVFQTPSGAQVIFPPAGAVLQALFVPLGGIYGLRLLSLISALVALWAAVRICGNGPECIALPLVMGLATPLWFYAVTEYEHAPAVALGALAFVLACRGSVPIAAGLLVGAGAAVRDEVALLIPGLLFAFWLRDRQWRPAAYALGGFGMALVLAGIMEVWWFGRPFAAHLQHAVHLLRKALDLTSQRNWEVPELAPLTLRQRYDYVVQYWLLGYGDNRPIALFGAMVAAAVALRLWTKSAWPLVAAALALLALAVVDALALLAAPKWVAGFYRLSPFAIFVLFPRPANERGDWLWRVALVTTAAYLLLAFAGVDTSGGKSLGPRLLLPLLPLVIASAWRNIADHARSAVVAERTLGWTGVALAAVALAIHAGSTIPAYVHRSADDAEAMRVIEAMPERVIVADDLYTGLQLLPLYYRRLILVADTPAFGREMGTMLAGQKIESALLVSRRGAPYIELTPLQRVSTMQVNRFRLESWKP